MIVDIGQTKGFDWERLILQPPSSSLAAILEFDICRLNLPHLAAIRFQVSYPYFVVFVDDKSNGDLIVVIKGYWQEQQDYTYQRHKYYVRFL